MVKKSKESRDFTKEVLVKVVERIKEKVVFYYHRTTVYGNLSFLKNLHSFFVEV